MSMLHPIQANRDSVRAILGGGLSSRFPLAARLCERPTMKLQHCRHER